MKAIARLSTILLAFIVFLSACSPTAPTSSPQDLTTPSTSGDGTVLFPRTVKDSQGSDVVVSHEPVRIVSATLGTDEVLFSLINFAHLAAITSNAADPAQSNIVPLADRVKTHLAKADPEAIIALNPDLIFVASYTDPGVIKQLKDAKLPVFVVGNFNSIKDIENNIRLIGKAVGEEVAAESVVLGMEAKLLAISQAIKGAKPASVLYYAPGGSSDGPGTLIDDIITRAGGVNAVVVGGIKDAYPQLNDEFVVNQNPDFIMLAGFNSYSPGFIDNFSKNPKFQTLNALRNKHAVVANDAHLTAASQYVVEGVADVAALIHPDIYNAETVKALSATLQTQLRPTDEP